MLRPWRHAVGFHWRMGKGRMVCQYLVLRPFGGISRVCFLGNQSVISRRVRTRESTVSPVRAMALSTSGRQ